MQDVTGLHNLDRQKSRMQTVWYCGIRQKEKGVQNLQFGSSRRSKSEKEQENFLKHLQNEIEKLWNVKTAVVLIVTKDLEQLRMN